ncbi:MAG: NFACT family protein, partial [Oscillospiraceae bacterium]|nr:NFACT family protein [Oscillospiraceae bacterium]
MDPLKSPQQNLENRYKRYRKAKGAKEHLGSLIAEGEKLLDYLNSVL